MMLPDIHFLHSSFYYELYESKGRPANFKFLELIDRGRLSDNLKVVKPRTEWEEMIHKAGFEIEQCVPHLSKTLVQMWDIGLRPLFPMLKKMTQQMEEEVLAGIKEEWVNLFYKIGRPVIENETVLTQQGAGCFLCYMLKKR